MALISFYLISHFAWTILFAVFLFIHAVATLTDECLRLKDKSIVHCQVISQNFWQLTTRAGKTYSAKLTGKFRTPWLIILSFEIYPSRNKHTLTICYDAVFKENYLKLLYRLW